MRVQCRTCAILSKVLALVTIFGASPWANASFSVFDRPLKLLTCELMLQSSVKGLSSQDSVLPVLRDAIYKVREQNPSGANNGTAFSSLNYAGSLSDMGANTAVGVVQRLNGIEENLTVSNLDAQTVSVEIRGDDVRKALAAMEARETELRQIYSSQRDKLYSPGKRGVLRAIALLGTVGTVQVGATLGLSNLSFETLIGAVFPGLLFLTNLNIGREAVNYNIERFDWNFLSLKKFLRKVTESESEKDFFIASSKIELPAEFHKFLMAAETQTSSEAAREIGIEEWGGPYYGRFLRRLLAGELFNSSREGRNATEADRNIYLDHVVFYDEVAKEPVWLFFYRAFRNQPVGRKPTERTQQEIQGVSEGVPGLSPVPVRKK